MHISRRTALCLSGAALAAGLPGFASAAESVVATTYPGSFDEAFKAVVGPAFAKASGSSVNFTPLLAVDQIGKIQASRANPPFDVVLFDEGPLINAKKADVLDKFPADKSKTFADIPEAFRDPDGYAPVVTCQVIGLAYNPKKIKTPPTSWDDLWRPEYKGRVGLTALNSSLGMAFMVELARLKGGSETNLEPAFKALKTLLPNVGAISANLGAHAALIQQEQVDIAVHNFNFIQTLKGKGVEVDWVKPSTGAPAWRTSMHLVKGAQRPDLAFEYIEGHITPEVQTAMEKAPHFVIPTNQKVALSGAIVEKVARTQEELGRLVFHDWAKINEGRSAAMERFNREIRL